MATTAWRLPGTAVGATWSNPDGIKLIDGSFASKSLGDGQSSGYIRGENFGFTTADIPAGSTINGIESRAVTTKGGPGDPGSLHLYIQKVAGTNVGDNKAASWPVSSNGTYIAGGAADLWGTTVTASEAIASTFAVAYQAWGASAKFGTSVSIGSIELRFHYTEGSSGSRGRRMRLLAQLRR